MLETKLQKSFTEAKGWRRNYTSHLQKPSVGDATTKAIYRSQVLETQLLKLLMIPVLNKIFLTLKRFDAHVPEHVVPHDAGDVRVTRLDVLQYSLHVLKKQLLTTHVIGAHIRLTVSASTNVCHLQHEPAQAPTCSTCGDLYSSDTIHSYLQCHLYRYLVRDISHS